MSYCGIIGKEVPVTAKQIIANKIDEGWIYSMYWSKNNNDWIVNAKEDMNAVIDIHKKRLKELNVTKEILNSINL